MGEQKQERPETRDELVRAYLTVKERLRALRASGQSTFARMVHVTMGERELAGLFLHLFEGQELDSFDQINLFLRGRYTQAYPNVRQMLERVAGRPGCSRPA